VCLEENEERQGLTNIALERQRFIEIPAEELEGKHAEARWQQIALMDTASRAELWQREFSKCIKCYGCRDVCPVCFCDQCELEDPGWVTPGRIPPEFPVFHLIRAYHVADKCINCGECETTCPVGIPLRSIQQLVWRQPPEKIFEFIPGLDEEIKEKLIKQVKEQPVTGRGVRR
jgi:ferredoxin